MRCLLDLTRRQFLGRASTGIGAAALASLLNPTLSAAQGVAGIPHFAPKAKRVIWLTQAGAPSQLDLFDYKPGLRELFDKDLPASVRNGQRVTGMTSGQARFPIAPSVFNFKQHGNAGHWLSELLPHTARLADDLCVIRSMHTEAINHDPAMTMLQTGSQVAGKVHLLGRNVMTDGKQQIIGLIHIQTAGAEVTVSLGLTVMLLRD